MEGLGFVGAGATVGGGLRRSGVVCRVEEGGVEVSRRTVLLSTVSVVGGLLGGAQQASADAVSGRSVVNGVLSAYGLPQIPDKGGFTPILEEYGSDKIVEFLYPSAWLVTKEQSGIDRPRLNLDRVVPTINIGDYRKAESLAFYSTPASGKDTFDVPVDKLAKIAIQLPNPDYRMLKDKKIATNGYRLTSFKFDTYTTSGYMGERRALVASTVIDDTVFLLGGVCSELRYKKIEELLLTAMENFKVTKVQSLKNKTA
ncbi:hypothetical protein NDN08_005684 [Rhodosorus marinus]|uniref:PsbP C-terminal domain-containing protein n=1 Tax=Rhodosorus marinus TaxID=101924 RepID=A0AAV8V2Q3_9RHOD|nr:hypothetical protein NDN08_005684 [Rhodosorus marinus]